MELFHGRCPCDSGASRHGFDSAEAYTGSSGAQDQNYTVEIGDDGVATFSTTQRLERHQGLTIVVTFPKG